MTFKKKLENLTVEEQSEVKLEVELSKPSDEVRWMKNSVVLQPAGNMEIRVDGAKQTLVFKSVTHADRGIYSCETLDDKTQGKLNVESKTYPQSQILSYNTQYLRWLSSNMSLDIHFQLRARKPCLHVKIQRFPSPPFSEEDPGNKGLKRNQGT